MQNSNSSPPIHVQGVNASQIEILFKTFKERCIPIMGVLSSCYTVGATVLQVKHALPLNVYRGRCFLGGWGVIQACRSFSGCSAPHTGAEQFMQVIPAIHQRTDYAQTEKVSQLPRLTSKGTPVKFL